MIYAKKNHKNLYVKREFILTGGYVQIIRCDYQAGFFQVIYREFDIHEYILGELKKINYEEYLKIANLEKCFSNGVLRSKKIYGGNHGGWVVLVSRDWMGDDDCPVDCEFCVGNSCKTFNILFSDDIPLGWREGARSHELTIEVAHYVPHHWHGE
jgi:hypothetical protein